MSTFGKQFAEKMRDKVATKLLTKFDGRSGGDRMALLRPGTKVWNPTTGEYEIGPDTKYWLTGVERTNLMGMVDGTTIQQGDELITASVVVLDETETQVDIVPKVDDKIILDGVQWSVVDAPHINYSGNTLIIAYKMQVRK